jgi:hypothetical protein
MAYAILTVSTGGAYTGSRRSNGKHRLGIVLASPLALFALGAVAVQIANPSGEEILQPIEGGFLAWTPSAHANQWDGLLRRQQAAGYTLPHGYIAVGLPHPSTVPGKTILRLSGKTYEVEAPDKTRMTFKVLSANEASGWR